MVGQGHGGCNAARSWAARSWWLLALLAVSPGCASESESSATLAAATYNAGLAYGFVPHATARREEVAKAVAALDADVVCLEEVWTDDDIALVEKTAKAAGYTNVHYVKTPEKIDVPLPAACTAGDTKDLQPCAAKNCGDKDKDELVGCVLGFCSAEFNAASMACQGCLGANVGKELDEIMNICTKPGGGTFSWGGYNGLMLLSKLPMKDARHTILDSILVRRAVLEAKVTAPAPIGDVSVLCTHLTANLTAIKYPSATGSYAQEQAKQIDVIIGKVKAAGGRALVMGDMNTGPDLKPDIKGELPDNYAKFLAAGLKDPYAKDGAKCTFCGENTLVSGGADKGGEAAIIDHIFLAGTWDSGATGKRIIDGKVTLKVKGKDEQHNVSDHFGVEIEAAVTTRSK